MTVRRRVRVRWFRVLTLLAAAYFIYLAVGQQFELYTIQRETHNLKNRIAELEQANNAMIDEKKQLAAPAYVEKIAREQLGLRVPQRAQCDDPRAGQQALHVFVGAVRERPGRGRHGRCVRGRRAGVGGHLTKHGEIRSRPA